MPQPTTGIDASGDAAPSGVGAEVRAALETVIDPCCRDRGISVVDMGLVHRVDVDAHGRARVEITLTSGWCPFQIDLVDQIGEAVRSVSEVTDADVAIVLEPVWSPQRLSESARSRLRLLPDPAQVADRDAFLSAAAASARRAGRGDSATPSPPEAGSQEVTP